MHVDATERATHTVQPTGILDSANGTKLRHAVDTSMQAGVRTVLVDCSQLQLIDSSGLSSLLACLKVLRSVDGNLILSGLNEQHQRLLALTGMDTVLTVLQGK
jgi:anti-sigma B factor antagonist